MLKMPSVQTTCAQNVAWPWDKLLRSTWAYFISQNSVDKMLKKFILNCHNLIPFGTIQSIQIHYWNSNEIYHSINFPFTGKES